MQSSKHLAEIADLINRREDWKFVLVYTNRKQPKFLITTQSIATIDVIIANLRLIDNWLSKDTNEVPASAILLFAWSNFEAAIYNALEPDVENKSFNTPVSLLRNAVMFGIISKIDHDYLEKIMKKRNQVAHGATEIDTSIQELKRLVQISKEIIELARSNI